MLCTVFPTLLYEKYGQFEPVLDRENKKRLKEKMILSFCGEKRGNIPDIADILTS